MAHALHMPDFADFTQELSAKLPQAVDKLPILPDLRGKYLLDYHATRGSTLPVWEYGPLGLHQLSITPALIDQERKLLSSLRPNECPILDLGAGYGRASAWLRDRGFDVTTSDPSPGARLLYRLRGWDNIANLVPADPLGRCQYAAILSLSAALNAVSSDEKLTRALANIHKALAPGGAFIGSITCQPSTTRPVAADPLAALLYSFHRSAWHKITLPDFDQFTSILKKVGFEITHISPSDQGKSQRFHFHATKL